MTRILGIDPGSRRTGYGIIDFESGKPKYVTSGIIRLPEKSLPDRLKIIFDGVSQIIGEYNPEQMAVEEVFFAKEEISEQLSKKSAKFLSKLLSPIILLNKLLWGRIKSW